MKNINHVSELPRDATVYVYGAGIGGRAILVQLRALGLHRVGGFIDTFQSGAIDDVPILRLDEFLCQRPADALIVIAVISNKSSLQISEELARHHVDRLYRYRAPRLYDPPGSGESAASPAHLDYKEVARRLTLALGLSGERALWTLLSLPGVRSSPPRRFALVQQIARLPRTRWVAVVGDQVAAEELVRFLQRHVPADILVTAIVDDDLYVAREEQSTCVLVSADQRGDTAIAGLRDHEFLALFPAAARNESEQSDSPACVRRQPDFALPLVSVVVRRNGRGTIARALASVLSQTYPNIEAIVLDNAPADGMRKTVASLGGRVSLVAESDGDSPAALLRVLRRCRGDVVATCMADEELLPHAVEDAVAAFRAHPDAGAITGGVYLTDGVGNIAGTIAGRPFSCIDYLFGKDRPRLVSAFFSASALDEIGLFDDEWNTEAVEFELWCRVGTRHRIAHMPAIVATAPIELRPFGVAAESIRFHLGQRIELLNRLFAPGEVLGQLPDASHRWLECVLRHFAHALNDAHDIGVPVCAVASGSTTGNARTTEPVRLPPPSASLHEEFAYLMDIRDQFDAAHHHRGVARLLTTDTETIDSSDAQTFLVHPASTNASLLAVQVEWADRHVRSRPLAVSPFVLNTASRAGRRIRVAYLCAYADVHYFTHLVLPLVKHHDTSRFEVYLYLGGKVSPDIHEATPYVRVIDHVSDEDVVALIRSDEIDILVETTGFCPRNRYRAMSARCAPLQMSWVNHAGTTGVPNLDYYIGDAVSLPEGTEPYYSEKLLRLPGCVFCFTYDPKTLPDVAPSPHLRSGRITFGYFGNASKLNSRLAELWARVLDATPGARLFLRFAALSHPANRRYVARMFARYGVTGDRLVLQPGTDREGILRSYADVDISLDSSPFCGGSSIAESLWQGVPVVTLRGERFASAYGSSILLASGLGDLVASTPDEYVEIASQLAGNTDRLVHLRSNLRTMVIEHGFSDATLFASRMEAAYESALAEQLLRRPWEAVSQQLLNPARSTAGLPVRLPAEVPGHAFAGADPSAEPRHGATSLTL